MFHSVRRACALALPLAGLSLAPLFATQQDLMVLGRFDKLWIIEDLNTPRQTVRELPRIDEPYDSQLTPVASSVALGADRASDDLFILRANWGSGDASIVEIWRQDGPYGSSTLEHTFSQPPGTSYGQFCGLAQRPDGRLVTIFRGADLAGQASTYMTILDTANGTTLHMELSGSVEPIYAGFFVGFDLDRRGVPTVLSQAGSLPSSGSVTVDTVSGQVTPASLPGAPFEPWGFVQNNAGEFFAGTSRGDFWLYDESQSAWVEVFDQGDLTINYLYGAAFTNVDHGNDFEVICEGTENSTGVASTLEFRGLSDVAARDLTLITRGLPTASTGFYLMGETQGLTPVGSGLLCIHSPLYRDYSSLAVANGPVAHTLDLSALANGQPAMAGTRQIFQFWHRDEVAGQATSNLSSAVAVDFQ